MDASNTGVQHTKVYAVRPNEIGSFTNDFFRPYMWVSFAVVNSRPFPFSQDRYYTAGDTRYSEGMYATFPYDGVANMVMTVPPGMNTTKTYFKGPFHAGTSIVRPPAARPGEGSALEPPAVTQAGAPPVPVKKALAWVSYDDGGTWKALPMLGADGSYSAVTRQPALKDTVGYAALKYEVTDANGATM